MMAYRILLVEDDSDSGTEQVAPPKGRHLRPDIKCGGFTPLRICGKLNGRSQGLRPPLGLRRVTAADQARRHCASDARALPPP